MKRFLYIILIFVFIAGSSLVIAETKPKIPIMPKRSEIMCPCGGCDLTAIMCGCQSAVDILKIFDKKFKGA